MNDLLNYIRSVVDRFGFQISVGLVLRPADPLDMNDCPECDPLSDEIIDAGEREN